MYIYVSMCLRLCACVCESRYAWVFTHVEDIGHFYLSLRLSFSNTWNLLAKQNWLASKPSEICTSLLPHHWDHEVQHHTHVFSMCLLLIEFIFMDSTNLPTSENQLLNLDIFCVEAMPSHRYFKLNFTNGKIKASPRFVVLSNYGAQRTLNSLACT